MPRARRSPAPFVWKPAAPRKAIYRLTASGEEAFEALAAVVSLPPFETLAAPLEERPEGSAVRTAAAVLSAMPVATPIRARELSAAAGLSVTRIYAALRMLEREGCVSRDTSQGRPASYIRPS
jgi:DNA-binding PadR family transcriptional regulator